MIPFASTDRDEYFQKLTEKKVHILVIGGGITGAGILLDAVNRGFEAALIEKLDFGSGTSSRSTKLIHGGLRYLKQRQFSLVRETGKERAIVFNNARHLVEKKKMLLPIYKGGTLGTWTTSIALWIYDYLAKVGQNEQKLMLKKETTRRTEPLLKQEGLKGSGLYYEYHVDDTRLTLEVIKKAVENGGTALNYAEARDFILDHGRIAGVEVVDKMTGKSYAIQAEYVVNATGPWSDQVAGLDRESGNIKRVVLSKGVHIVVPFYKLPVKQAVYFENRKDRRMIFAIPWWGHTYIGTTDTAYEGDPDHIHATAEDVEYLVEATNTVFTRSPIRTEDITSTWAGVRPLVYEKGKTLGELSRKDEVFKSPGGLITITGGKLTGYRKMAERVVQLIIDDLKENPNKPRPVLHEEALTDLSNISGSEFRSEEEFKKLKLYCLSLRHHLEVDEDTMEKLFHRYGTNTEKVVALAETFASEVADPYLRIELGSLLYGIRQEMVCSLSDHLVRRTSQLYFGRNQILKYLEPLADLLASELDLTESQIHADKETFLKEYEAVMSWQKEKNPVTDTFIH